MEQRADIVAAVFEACIADLDLGTPQIIDALTSTGYMRPEPKDQLDQTARYVAKDFPQADDSALRDFVDRNLIAHQVADTYPLDERFKPMTQSEMAELFRRDIDAGWERFRELYPHSRGTMGVSAVGLSDDEKQAVLYIGRQFDGLAGHGTIYILGYTDAGWSVLGQVGTWIS